MFNAIRFSNILRASIEDRAYEGNPFQDVAKLYDQEIDLRAPIELNGEKFICFCFKDKSLAFVSERGVGTKTPDEEDYMELLLLLLRKLEIEEHIVEGK